jgi:AraC-type DNA-binding domain-containing proteins
MAPRASTEELTFAKKGLLDRIARLTSRGSEGAIAIPHGVFVSPLPSLALFRIDAPTQPMSIMNEPSVCLVAQGAKRVYLGDRSYLYDADHFLIIALDVPIISEVVKASVEEPCFSLMLRLDQKTIAQLMVDATIKVPRAAPSGRALAVSEVGLPLINAFLRLIDLAQEPGSVAALRPLIEKEIAFRLLVGEQGPQLRQIASAGCQSFEIARAIEWLKENYARSIKVEELAELCTMSASSFHRHFRTLTSMSPLQYQKTIRLHEARRLMLAERLDAASAAYRVGYESPSQFSREYNRLFKASPLRDIKALQSQGGDESLAMSTGE